VEGIDCAVTLLVRKGFEDAWSVCQALAVSSKLGGDVLPLETSVFGKDPIPSGPTGYRNIDDAELLPKEVRLADLVGEALEIFGPFA